MVIGVTAIVVLGAGASVGAVLGAQEQQRLALLADVEAAATAYESELAAVSAAEAGYEADLAEADELAAELSAALELPSQRFDASAWTEVQRSLEQLETSSPLPVSTATTVPVVSDEATADELRSAKKNLADAIDALDDRAAEFAGLQTGLADAVTAARTSAKTLVDGVIGSTETLLVANAVASVETSDRVRTVVAGLGEEWTADGLRDWIAAVAALEASTAEAAARLALEQQEAERALEYEDVETGWTATESPAPDWMADIPIAVVGPPSSPPPEDPIVNSPPVSDVWPLLWNEYWRPIDQCGTPRVVKSFPTYDFGNGLESGMSSPWSHEWLSDRINVLACNS
ncbi:hypothetical protein [Agromyces salentinus]|uniref:DUF2599 domain-containing protein n=1 Tax=Agromyces salentinus TaxID=269421 RepID=A0ABN2ME96_9MICO|nr:hypothetical protein [Agromyces salentinus]